MKKKKTSKSYVLLCAGNGVKLAIKQKIMMFSITSASIDEEPILILQEQRCVVNFLFLCNTKIIRQMPANLVSNYSTFNRYADTIIHLYRLELEIIVTIIRIWGTILNRICNSRNEFKVPTCRVALHWCIVVGFNSSEWSKITIWSAITYSTLHILQYENQQVTILWQFSEDNANNFLDKLFMSDYCHSQSVDAFKT